MLKALAADRGLKPIVLLAIAGLAALAIGALLVFRIDSPAALDELQKMDCKELAVEMLYSDEARRRAASKVFARKKCF